MPLKAAIVPVTPFQQNCTLLWDEATQAGAVVDPGGDLDRTHRQQAFISSVEYKLKQQGILVRYFDLPGLTDKIRITVGRSEENNALLGGIKSISLGEKAA